MLSWLSGSAKPEETAKPKKKIGRPTRAEAQEKRRQQLAEMATKVKTAQLAKELARIERGDDDAISLSRLKAEGREIVDSSLRASELRQIEELKARVKELEGEVRALERENDKLERKLLILENARGGGLAELRSLFDTELGRNLGEMLGGKVGTIVGPRIAQNPEVMARLSAAAGQHSPNGAAHNSPADAPAQPQPQQEEAIDMDLAATILRNGLNGRNARERAAWLAGQPMLKEVVPGLCGTPDTELMETLARTAQGQPAYRGALEWIISQGDTWVLETVRELRKLVGIEP